MAVITKEEMLKAIREKFTDSNEDLTTLENIVDTFKDIDERLNEDWKAKYEQNDKEWRERYRARFEDAPVPKPQTQNAEPHLPVQEEPAGSNITINDLFE